MKEKYYVIRTEKSGVFAAQIKNFDDVTRKYILKDSRRLWYWDGAASLSELSQEGVNKPENCKFPMSVPEHISYLVIEVIPMTEKAITSIKNVKIWSGK